MFGPIEMTVDPRCRGCGQHVEYFGDYCAECTAPAADEYDNLFPLLRTDFIAHFEVAA